MQASLRPSSKEERTHSHYRKNNQDRNSDSRKLLDIGIGGTGDLAPWIPTELIRFLEAKGKKMGRKAQHQRLGLAL
jgi:hypothetical protein